MNGLFSEIHDRRVEYVLHAMPAEAQLVSVVNAPNIVFEQPIFQLPDPETCLQLFAFRCFWDIYNEIQRKDVSLGVYCTLRPEPSGPNSKYPTAHFAFLTSNEPRDRRIQRELSRNAILTFEDNGETTYELSETVFFCMPKPGMLIYTNDRLLMRIVLSRLDAWWLDRVALPSSFPEWKHVDQEAPYWGIRHFPPDDLSSPAHYRSMVDSQAIGLTFQYTDNSHDLQMMYLSQNSHQQRAASNLIKDADPWTARHILCSYIDACTTQVLVSDSRCLSGAVYSALEWFDPMFAMEVEQLRRHHK